MTVWLTLDQRNFYVEIFLTIDLQRLFDRFL